MANRAIRTTLPDGRTALNNIIDKFTGESIQLVKIPSLPAGVTADGIIYFQTNDTTWGIEYWTRNLIDGFVSIKWFGAKGDGITDDTNAIETALQNYSKVIFDQGKTYSITRQVDIRANEVILRANKAKILVNGLVNAALDFQGEGLSIDSLVVDGNANSQYGVYARGKDISILNCEIYNIVGRGIAGEAIRIGNVSTIPLSNIIISNNYIYNITAPLDGDNGTSYGASRAIRISSDSPLTDRGVVIQNNRIENIISREGDAIQFLINGGGSIYEKLPSIISNNYIKNCTRRYIKIQASNVSISDNICENELSSVEMSNANSGIGVVWGQSCDIYNNKVDARLFPYGVSLEGNSNELTSNITIYNNNIKSGVNTGSTWSNPTSQRGIFTSECTRIIIKGNTISNNGKIECLNVEDSSIINNFISADDGDSSSNGVIRINENCKRLQIINNTGVGPTTASPAMLINMNGQDCIVMGNKADYGQAGYSIIRCSETSFRNFISNNNLITRTFNLVSGPSVSQNYVAFNNTGGSTAGVAKSIYFSNSIPTTGNYRTGDIIFRILNLSTGTYARNVGWICTSGSDSDSGGAWMPFGMTNIYSGTGAPNISVEIGSLYFRAPSTATEDTVLYIKTTPAGTSTGWKSLSATTAASADTATQAAGAEPTKAEFDALLAELRDLKTKMRTAGLLAT